MVPLKDVCSSRLWHVSLIVSAALLTSCMPRRWLSEKGCSEVLSTAIKLHHEVYNIHMIDKSSGR